MMSLSKIMRFLGTLSRPYPARDWFIALISIFIIFLALSCYAVFVFFAAQTGTLFTGGESAPASVTLTRADLQKALDVYDVRAVNYDAHNLSVPPVVDPSK